MRKHARKWLGLAILGIAGTGVALVSAAPAAAQGGGLQSFENFNCPSDCPAGADPCCAILPPIIVVID